MLGRDNATIPLAATENVEKRPEGQSPLGIGRAMLPADRQPRSELLFLPVSVSALRISMDPSKVLNKDEMNAFEDLKAAGDHRFLKVGATVDNESGLVNLHFQRPLTAEDAQPLRRISKLGMLFFTLGEYGTLSDESLRFLDGAGMKGLFIWRQPITDSGLQALKLFPKLIDLVLKETRVTDAGLAFLRDRPLKTLSVARLDISDAGLKTIAELENLETLSISHSSKITDDGVAHLSPLANLEGLFLHDNDLVSGAVMTRFRSLKKLKRLAINAAEVNSEDLRHLAEFDSLESLSVARTNVDDTGIKSLVAPKSLKALNIQETRITDTGLAMLGKAKQLASLGLSKTAITDDGMTHLSGLTDLISLNLSGTNVGDQGIAALRRLTKLEGLGLDGTKITDASVETISGFKGLSYLNIEGTAVSAEGKKRIQSQLPKCKIASPRSSTRLR